MWLFLGLFMMAFGAMLVYQRPKANFVDNRTPEEIERAKQREDWNSRPYYPIKEYLLVYIVYAHYARQENRQDPFRDAILHTRLYELQQGWKCSGGEWNATRGREMTHLRKYVPIDQIDRDFFCQITSPEKFYLRGADKKESVGGWVGSCYVLQDKVTRGEPFAWFREYAKDWPFPGGLYKSLSCPTGANMEFRYEPDVFNRITEWYYLVMFRDEFLASGADIRDALYPEEPHNAAVERQIEFTVQNLLSIGQDIVRNGDWWEQWTLEQIAQREAQAVAKAEAERIAREAPGEERRRKLLYGDESENGVTSYYSPEWARQQLKEKYGIDYPENKQEPR